MASLVVGFDSSAFGRMIPLDGRSVQAERSRTPPELTAPRRALKFARYNITERAANSIPATVTIQARATKYLNMTNELPGSEKMPARFESDETGNNRVPRDEGV